MLIDISIACVTDTDTGRSECSLLLETLSEYRQGVEDRQKEHGIDSGPVLRQLSSICQSIQDGMLKALEAEAHKDFSRQ